MVLTSRHPAVGTQVFVATKHRDLECLWLWACVRDVAGINRSHDGCWVNRCSTTGVHFEVQVRCAGIAGCTIGAQNLTSLHRCANCNVWRNGVEVSVKVVGAISLGESHAVASQAGVVVHASDGAVNYCIDQVAGRGHDVDTFVTAATTRLLPGVGE